MGSIGELSPVYLAVVHYQRKEYDECIEICSKVLDKNPYDEAIWSLKTRALTAQVRPIPKSYFQSHHCRLLLPASLYINCILLMISYLGNSR